MESTIPLSKKQLSSICSILEKGGFNKEKKLFPIGKGEIDDEAFKQALLATQNKPPTKTNVTTKTDPTHVKKEEIELDHLPQQAPCEETAEPLLLPRSSFTWDVALLFHMHALPLFAKQTEESIIEIL